MFKDNKKTSAQPNVMEEQKKRRKSDSSDKDQRMDEESEQTDQTKKKRGRPNKETDKSLKEIKNMEADFESGAWNLSGKKNGKAFEKGEKKKLKDSILARKRRLKDKEIKESLRWLAQVGEQWIGPDIKQEYHTRLG